MYITVLGFLPVLLGLRLLFSRCFQTPPAVFACCTQRRMSELHQSLLLVEEDLIALQSAGRALDVHSSLPLASPEASPIPGDEPMLASPPPFQPPLMLPSAPPLQPSAPAAPLPALPPTIAPVSVKMMTGFGLISMLLGYSIMSLVSGRYRRRPKNSSNSAAPRTGDAITTSATQEWELNDAALEAQRAASSAGEQVTEGSKDVA